jgi:undecaprenyl diphosphate synthase
LSRKPSALPRHAAIIMDGNGRWAKKRGLPRTAGHAAGAENFRRIATHCKNLGLPYLTVYAFSTENWKRPRREVLAIFDLLRRYLRESLEDMERDRVKLRFLGDLSPLPEDIRELIDRTRELSGRYEGLTLSVCLNYGGRDEILRAARRLLAEDPQSLSEERFGDLLDTAGLPDPDMLIRPGGEYRQSNFLLWQAAYAELFFTDTLWPDFTPEELDGLFTAYAKRKRRYGAV